MSSSSFEQRRDAFRVGMTGRARVQRSSGESAEYELRDLSVGGARLVGGVSLELDETVTIVFSVNEEAVTVAARVVRLDAHGCGVRFGQLARALESRISRYLTDEQRRRARPRT